MQSTLGISFFDRHKHLLLTFGFSIAFGTGWFLAMYGPHTLNPTYVDWIYVSGTDLFQHQIGWEWFRQEPWRFPLGSIRAFGYPFGTTVSFNDSIPLFAFGSRLLYFILPQNFQYLGLWTLFSTIGQFFFGMLILGEFTDSFLKKILGASLLVLSPIMIHRVFDHNSLSAHWILLAGIWFTLIEYRRKLWRGAWFILFAISLLVHLYFVPMLIPLWVICMWFRFQRERSFFTIVLDSLLLFSVVLLVGFSIGLFALSYGVLSKQGYGHYSWNLNGFINPLHYGLLLSDLPLGTEGQYEGFSYLALGNLVLFPLGLFLFIKEDLSKRKINFFIPYILVCCFLILFALSNKAFANTHLLWDFRTPQRLESLFGLFRSSGRFIWPVFYFIVLFILISIIKKSKIVVPIYFVALLLQFIDLQPLITSKQIQGSLKYQSPLQSEFWSYAANSNKHVVLLPASSARRVYEPFALYARKNYLTLNWGYFSRANLEEIKEYGEQLWFDVLSGKADESSLYILWDSEWLAKSGESVANNLIICKVDGYIVGFSPENSLVESSADLDSYCSFP